MAANVGERQFYRKMLLVGVPVVFQNLIGIGLNLIDTLMIGMLGEEQLAAVGAANQVYFIFTVTLFGLYSGAAIYTAQYWGARDIAGVRRMLGIGYGVGFPVSLAVTVVAFLFAPQILSLFSREPSVIGYGVDYLRIACFSYAFSGVSSAISYNSRAIQDLKVPTLINAAALAVNATLNYLLIFGVSVFPAMGVRGAAVATLTARVFELAALLLFVYTKKNHPFRTGWSALFSFDRAHFFHVMRTALPVVFTEASWAVSVSAIFAAYGMLGTSALAVAQVANVVLEMLQCAYFGVGNATAMLIGETLGQGDKEEAYRNGSRAVRTVWLLNVVTTIAMLLLAKPIAGVYHFGGETHVLLVHTLMTMAVLITPRMLSYIYIVGILRAGGDTLYSMVLEIVCTIFIQISMAYFAVLVLHTSLPVAMVMVEMGNVVRIVFGAHRFRSRKWINIVTEDARQTQ